MTSIINMSDFVYVGCFLFLSLFLQVSQGVLLDNNPYSHSVTLANGKYHLIWTANLATKEITFNVTVETRGYVGLGLARRGKMAGADIVIGGLGKDGKPYFRDYHAIGNQLPVEDPSQDWILHDAEERGGQTYLSFSRAFDTCDADHDLPISNDLLSIIWAFSDVDDELQYHFQNRGSYDAYLLDPDLTPRNLESVRSGAKRLNMSVHSLTTTIRVLPQDTMYWCRFYKLPFTRKQHIIGFNTHFPTEVDRRHVHHLLLHRCRAPPGHDQNEFFEEAAAGGGSECYLMDFPNPLPTTYCRETIHVWGVGGNTIFFPTDAGMAMGDEFFMFQVHYDNPNVLSNLTITVGLEMFYTSNLRKNEVGLLQLGGMQPAVPSNLIPPGTQNQIIMGHCAPGCIDRFVPQEGITLFATFLHTHISGRGIRALHFRGNQELPWIQADDNYNFNFQQFRVLNEPRKVFPRDLLMMRCQYDSTGRNGSVVHGGFSTREEMCSVFIYYHTVSPGFALCRSEIRDRRYFDLIGLGNVTWNQAIRQNIVTAPERYRGMTFLDFANNHIKFDLKTRETLQQYQLYLPQVSQCPRFYYDSPTVQLQEQLRAGFLERTGRLPGSDGRRYASVDEDFEHESVLPRKILRYTKPPQCIRHH